MALDMKSPAFTNNDFMPAKYTGEGEDISPPLEWSNVPSGTVSFAIIADDPDAPIGDWVHWVIYNIPAGTTGLSEGMPPDAALPDGAKQGMNDFRKTGYGGPYPPPGRPHRYFFKIYALNTKLNLSSNATKKDLLRAIEGHILGQAELIGLYKR